MRVKVGRLDGEVVNLAPEHADCERAARSSGAPVKTVWAQALRRARTRPASGAPRRARRATSLRARSSAASRAIGSAVVAFSGGVDSSLVAAVAARALGTRALAVTAVSPAVAAGELDGARRVAAAVGIAHETIATDELARDGYRRNGPDRCYFCKSELYDALAALAERRGYRALLSGANADDAGDWRPGLRAAAEHGVVHPLLDAGRDQGRRARAGPRAGRAERGQAGHALPGLAHPLRHGGRPGDAARASTAPSAPCARSASPCCACATTASSGGSRSPPTTSTARSQREPRDRRRRSAPRATRTR